MKNIPLKRLIIFTFALQLCSCNDYLDVTPDNIATIDYAFRMRSTAERFLFTCYSYMPDHGTIAEDPGILGCDELWLNITNNNNAAYIARGAQKVVNPYLNEWQGGNGGKDLYEGIRQCNVLLENIEAVPDMDPSERRRWTAEAKFLKAYYHLWLVQCYGPVVLIKSNLPVSASPDEVKIPRSPVDECFDYIITLLDEAYRDLPDQIQYDVSELGRITKAICLSIKAKALVTAASPLFNGNSDYRGFTNHDGTPLFNTTEDPKKWELAATACKKAIDYCDSIGHKLYVFTPGYMQMDALSDTTIQQLTLRNAFCDKWNSEIIWGNTNSWMTNSGLQRNAHPRGLDPALVANTGATGNIGVPLKMAEMFYSENGVPITEDTSWDYANRFSLRESESDDRFYIKQGYITAQLNFRREPRYYAWLGFDGGIWYGQGHNNDKGSDILYLQCKAGQAASPINKDSYNTTGIYPKKYVHYLSAVVGTSSTYTTENYPWPVIRLADLYLLYAEALNEVYDNPDPDVYNYVNTIRTRAGLPTVEDAWTNYTTSTKFTTQEGMREIIHRERTIELAFEGSRFWDVRRWKTGTTEWNSAITGWDYDQSSEQGYYRERLVENQTFNTRDYLWPLNENCILANPTLVQNPGWK
ncbi:MAG: RagB/SusD family nutrient uptake outer membrane protein [Bacteroidales bacterium]|nr:RagB/SusD family nutrient uptake outer membrane protein [Bacteroidales bacterium]